MLPEPVVKTVEVPELVSVTSLADVPPVNCNLSEPPLKLRVVPGVKETLDIDGTLFKFD
jgi:hypothetical protein